MICSLSRFDIETAGCSFFWHTERDHNPEHYFFFYFYLAQKSSDDYTGPEGYVQEALDATDVHFIPINTCAALNGNADNGPDCEELVDMIDDTRDALKEQLAEMENTIKLQFENLRTLMDNVTNQFGRHTKQVFKMRGKYNS